MKPLLALVALMMLGGCSRQVCVKAHHGWGTCQMMQWDKRWISYPCYRAFCDEYQTKEGCE